MAKRFLDGDLTEIEMYRSLLQIALHDSENSEYPSERKGAMDKVIDISRRLEEVNERNRREGESDETSLIPKCDALFFGTSVAGCERIMHELNSENIKAIEDASNS